MKVLKKIGIGLVVLIVLLAVVGFMIPGKYKVERSVTIQAPADVVFDQVNDFKKTEAWSPWKAADPNMTISYGPVTAGKGAMSSWESKSMGSGSQTIEESTPNQLVRIDLDFKAQGQAKCDYTFSPQGEGVKVTQTMTGEMGMNPFKHYMGLMMGKFVGPMFDKGLASLKQVSEARAAELKTEAATRQAAATPAEEAPAAPAAHAK